MTTPNQDAIASAYVSGYMASYNLGPYSSGDSRSVWESARKYAAAIPTEAAAPGLDELTAEVRRLWAMLGYEYPNPVLNPGHQPVVTRDIDPSSTVAGRVRP